MCGFTGFIDLKGSLTQEEAEQTVSAMTTFLHHRGPDDRGIWLDKDAHLALGHTRLSILDLSSHGHQPMSSHCGRYILVYNGEVYNHLEIRKNLSGDFHSNSDTETLVEAIAAWGIDKTLSQLNGMFAFALWDRQEQMLTLVRDRLGVKPLYWGLNQSTFFFGSELKSLKALPLWERQLDKTALHQYLQYAYVPAPTSIYQNIYKLTPGNYLTYKPGQTPTSTCYWSAQQKAHQGTDLWTNNMDIQEKISECEALLKDAVKLRLLADVPLGAFLSGGVDSSAVVALMQASSTTKVKTYSIGFEDQRYDEALFAKQVAQHLGTDHTELYVSPDQAMHVIPALADYYDEPFADSSQIPTFLVSQLARKSVTVSLSGDGGDEVFGGYNRYTLANKYLKTLKNIPYPFRTLLSRIAHINSPQTWDLLAKYLPSRLRPRHVGDKIYKIADLLESESEDDVYLRLVSCFYNPNLLLKDAQAIQSTPLDLDLPDIVSRMQLQDMLTYLPDDILTKVDRASMAVSLEARVPLLDYRVVEYAWSLPTELKLRNGHTKWILRQILYKYVPKALIERPKMGFAIPIDQWLRGPLREWIQDLLSADSMKDHFQANTVQNLLDEHMSGKRNHQHQLWTLAMFQQWRKKWL